MTWIDTLFTSSMDFTIDVYSSLMTTLLDSGYLIMPVSEWSRSKQSGHRRQLLLRHDVDMKPTSSLTTAGIEHSLGVRGTYYFRITPGCCDVHIIKKIASLGHEIGYHYEDLGMASQQAKVNRRKAISLAKASADIKGERRKAKGKSEQELAATAIELFRNNLEKLREIAPINTICMHGSPMSRYDSRLIWKYYDYRELGITAEPYFDFSLDDMLYLTDTGRRWDGSVVSIRDRLYGRDVKYYEQWVRKPVAGSAMAMTVTGVKLHRDYKFRKTGDILSSSKAGCLPEKILLTLHPQRWSNSIPLWMAELVAQNIKNTVKYIINRQNFGSGN